MITDNQPITFAQFMRSALYDPQRGYYRQSRMRIGREGADFITSSSFGHVFGKLVLDAATNLLKPQDPAGFTFVEIGAEPGTELFKDIEHAFCAMRQIRLGDPLEMAGSNVVFANEWLDAFPFHRLRFRDGSWREYGVHRNPDTGQLTEIELEQPSAPASRLIDRLPASSTEGYRVDLSIEAIDALQKLAQSQWAGTILLFDYGKSIEELVTVTPQGTARAYRQHEQSNDLLSHPGEQDLTAHVCWDFAVETLENADFTEVHVDRQESFLMRFAQDALRDLVESGNKCAQTRAAVANLLHPAGFGHKFQVLHARRIGP